jgi:hypothetical protein
MHWLSQFRPSRRKTAAPQSPATKLQLLLETLEDRTVPSTTSSIMANFNGTSIAAGNNIWFNSSFTASGLPRTGAVTVHAVNGAINFTAGGTAYHVDVPNAVVVLTNGATSASATFDPGDNDWDVSAPASGAGDVFLTGATMAVPTSGLPGNIHNVTWSADFWADTPGVTVNWKWAAAVYRPGFDGNYNDMGVKAVDSNNLTLYHNGDQSGAPEAYKSLVVAGATGGGGTNYTGNFTGNAAVKPTVGDGLQDYPYVSNNPLTNIAFNESTVLKGANLDTVNGYFQLWYSDEHALALGVGSVVVKTAAGSTTTNYPIAPLTSNPGAAVNPALGATATSGDQAGTDVSGRPMAPSLYITDTTTNPNNRSGDWQWGGSAYAPNAVFGTWKSFTRVVDYTTGSPAVSVVTSADPAKNNWNLGAGADPVPAGLSNEGYGAEVRWNLSDLGLLPGHTYRFYVMVHDGDQNKVGGDAGQASFTYTLPGQATQPAAVSGFVFDASGAALPGVTLTLTGTDSQNHAVVMTTTTLPDGSYSFSGLLPGTYTITQTVPDGYSVYSSSVGTVNNNNDGNADPSLLSISQINLASGDSGVNYDFWDVYGNNNPGS